ALVELHHAAQDGHGVVLGERADRLRDRQIQLAVQLIAPDAAEIVATGMIEQVVDERARVLERRRVARAQLAIYLKQRVLRRLDGILVQCRLHEGRYIGLAVRADEGESL